MFTPKPAALITVTTRSSQTVATDWNSRLISDLIGAMPHAQPEEGKNETESKTKENAFQNAWAAADTSAPRKFPAGGDSIVRGDRVIDVTTKNWNFFLFLTFLSHQKLFMMG